MPGINVDPGKGQQIIYINTRRTKHEDLVDVVVGLPPPLPTGKSVEKAGSVLRPANCKTVEYLVTAAGRERATN